MQVSNRRNCFNQTGKCTSFKWYKGQVINFIVGQDRLISGVTLKAHSPGLRQFLATESSFKMMKNVFYFTLKALFVLKIFKFLS